MSVSVVHIGISYTPTLTRYISVTVTHIGIGHKYGVGLLLGIGHTYGLGIGHKYLYRS